jgi:hypothetical protein
MQNYKDYYILPRIDVIFGSINVSGLFLEFNKYFTKKHFHCIISIISLY